MGIRGLTTLKVLNGAKLMLDYHENNLDSFIITLESFRSFLKPVTGQELFFAVSYTKPALSFITSNKYYFLVIKNYKLINDLLKSLEFPKFFSITKTIFSHSRSEQFWYQNAISYDSLSQATFSSHITRFPLMRILAYARASGGIPH